MNLNDLQNKRLKPEFKTKGLSKKQTSTINNVLRMHKNEQIDAPRVNEVQSLIKGERHMAEVKQKKAEMKAFMLIVIIPLITVFINTAQQWTITNIWQWDNIIDVISWFIAPACLAWLKGNYDVEKEEKATESRNAIESLKNENQSLKLTHELQKQEINFIRKGVI